MVDSGHLDPMETDRVRFEVIRPDNLKPNFYKWVGFGWMEFELDLKPESHCPFSSHSMASVENQRRRRGVSAARGAMARTVVTGGVGASVW